MTVDLRYGVTFGKCDSSDWIDWEIDLTEEEEKIYNRAVRLRIPLEDVSELKDVLSRAYDDIEAEEIENSLACDDEYTQECTGRYPVDADDINDLVRSGDQHAIEFFGLQELSKEELEEWDANDLDELPDVCDFEEGFEASSPYDCGWTLYVEFVDPNEDGDDLSEEEATEVLKELFAEANGNYEEIFGYIERCDYYYDPEEYSTLGELAESIAAEMGLEDFELPAAEGDE